MSARRRAVALGRVLLFLGLFKSWAQPLLDGSTVESFFTAIQENDTNTVFRMLDNNTNLTNALYYGRLPLHVAASEGRVEIVRRLLERGADINAISDALDSSNLRLTALHVAIWYDRSNICLLLLKAGANPNLQSSFDGSALHYAFFYQRPEMAAWLLDYGANPFLEKSNPLDVVTPFEMAITRGDGRLVPRMLAVSRKYLGEPGPARGDRRDQPKLTLTTLLAERGQTWLAVAAERGELEAVQALLKAGVRPNKEAEDGIPWLHPFALSQALAARRTNFDPQRSQQIRDLLIQNGAVYDAFAATALGDIDHARRLWSADKNVVRTRDRQGKTVLHWAAQTDQLPLTSFWLEAGADPAATNSAGQTALHLAAAEGFTRQLEILLQAGAPVDTRDANGWTPLDTAIHANHAESIRMLLAVKTVTPRPERALPLPIHDAAASGNIAALAELTADQLEARNELGLTPFQVAVRSGHFAAAALLVDRGAAVNARDPDANTVLHWSITNTFGLVIQDRPPAEWLARMGADARKQPYLKYFTPGPSERPPRAVLQTAGFLLACGLDVRATNRAGQTAIQLAMEDTATLFEDRAPLLRMLAGAGGDLNAPGADGNTALHLAGRDLTVERTASLIESGADLNATNNQGRTPLHVFAEHLGGWSDDANQPFQFLLKSKPDVNAQDNEGLTPLHVLASGDSPLKTKATRALLEAGANPNLRDKLGRNPIHLFLAGKWPWDEAAECIDLLVHASADLSAKDNQGKTPLHYLAALGPQKPLFFMRKIGDTFVDARVDFQSRDQHGDTALHLAARTGTGDVFDWLVKNGGDLDATNNAGETPRLLAARARDPGARFGPPDSRTDIFQAVRGGNLEAVSSLLKGDGALANATNQFGQTPLHVAAMAHRPNMIEFLERNGARWDEVSAVMARRPDVLREILAQRPAAVSTVVFGRHLIHMAVDDGAVDIINVLLGAKAEVRAADSSGLSALGHALLKKRIDIAELLLERGARINFFDAIYTDDLGTAKRLLSEDRSLVSITNGNGASPVQIAAGTGRAGLLKLLLSSHAPVDAANPRDGTTPLHLAAKYNQTNTAQLLIRHGAKLEVRDGIGLTPLHWAAAEGSRETLTLLLTAKANPNAPVVPSSAASDAPGFLPMRPGFILAGATPLHLAAFHGQTNVIELLLKSGVSVNATNLTGSTPLDLATQFFPASAGFWVSSRQLNIFESTKTRPSTGPVMERRKAAAVLLEKFGGKHFNSSSTLAGPPGI